MASSKNPQITNYTGVDVTTGTATSTAAAATINAQAGVVTTESLTTAAGAVYTFTLTNSLIKVGSLVNVVIGNGTNTTGQPTEGNVTCSAGSASIIVYNSAASAALNGTITIGFIVFNIS